MDVESNLIARYDSEFVRWNLTLKLNSFIHRYIFVFTVKVRLHLNISRWMLKCSNFPARQISISRNYMIKWEMKGCSFTWVQHELRSRLMKCQWATLVWHAPKHATSSSLCPSPIHNPIWLPRGRCLMSPTGVSSMCVYQQSLLLVELSQRLIAYVISHFSFS